MGRDATYSMLNVRCVFTIVGGIELLRVIRLGAMYDDKDGLLYTAARGATMNDVLARQPDSPNALPGSSCLLLGAVTTTQSASIRQH
jgi:hypothetical protein